VIGYEIVTDACERHKANLEVLLKSITRKGNLIDSRSIDDSKYISAL